MSDASDWLINTAKRNPEALLVLGAGCALLLRSGGRPRRAEYTRVSGSGSSGLQTAAGAAGDAKDRIADAGASLAGQAGEMARNLSAQTSQLAGQAQSMIGSSFGQLLRDQPLALVAAGVVAGVAVAALLPPTDLEERALGGARDAISDMASKVGGNLTAAATDAGQRLTKDVTGRAAESFKEVAQDFVGQVAGSPEKPSEPPDMVRPSADRFR